MNDVLLSLFWAENVLCNCHFSQRQFHVYHIESIVMGACETEINSLKTIAEIIKHFENDVRNEIFSGTFCH